MRERTRDSGVRRARYYAGTRDVNIVIECHLHLTSTRL